MKHNDPETNAIVARKGPNITNIKVIVEMTVDVINVANAANIIDIVNKKNVDVNVRNIAITNVRNIATTSVKMMRISVKMRITNVLL